MTCSVCGGPVSKRNIVGICQKSPECRKANRRAKFDRWYPTHKDEAAASYAAWYANNREKRAERKREWRQDPEVRARQLAQTQAFKTDPENAERVRGYNRRGRNRYMARADRPCLSPGGCTEHALVNRKYCREHQIVESRRGYHRRASRLKQRLAERQDWACPLCSELLPTSPGSTHVDHVIPRAVLAIEDEWNLQLTHARCNQEKSDRITPRAIELAAEHGLVLSGVA